MRKAITVAWMAALVIAAGTGCTTVVKYDLTNLLPARPDLKRQAMRVAVARLQDMRPAEEKNPPISFSKIETRDSMFKDGDVVGGISHALVSHFNHVQLFKSAEMVDQSVARPSSDVLEKMKGAGFDAVFTGTVKHYHGAGYATTFDEVALVLALIPISIVVTIPVMLMEDNQHEGFVEIIDAQLTDTRSGESLWSGAFSRKREMQYADAYPAAAASETLKEIAGEIVKQIETTNMK